MCPTPNEFNPIPKKEIEEVPGVIETMPVETPEEQNPSVVKPQTVS